MNRGFISNFYKISIAVLGGLCFTLALFNLRAEVLTWKFALLLLFTVLIAPRMSITFPRSKFILSFSDSMVFLTFLLFGGGAAVLVATVEMFANCLNFKLKGVEFARYTIPFNIGAIALATGITYYIWSWLPKLTNINPTSPITTHLITTLGVLALSQFFGSSVFAAIFYSLKRNTTLWTAWKKEGFSI